MNRFVSRWPLLAASLFAVGCGGSSFTAAPADAGGEAAAPLTADRACGDNAHARCTKIETCSSSLLADTYVDEGTCETRFKLSCMNALAAPDTGNTPASSEACALSYAGLSCDDFLDDQPSKACLQQLGSRAAGQPCSEPGQCQSGFCAIPAGSECGTCEAVPQAGDSCLGLTTCGQLLDCYESTCIAFALQGGACNKGQLCGAGLYCVGSTSTANGACQPAVETLGAMCDPQAKTGPGCDRNVLLTCNDTTRACATLQLASAGQPCGTVNGQLALCAGADTCAAVPGADAGTTTALETCIPPAMDGALCDLVAGPFCLTPARCISADGGTTGTCQFEDPTKCP